MNLDVYPNLPWAEIRPTQARAYLSLLAGEAS